MENAQEILVVFLSVALAVFLILGIILFIICIKIANRIKRISEKAEAISGKAENIAEFLSKSAVPLAAGKIIAVVTEVFKRSDSKRRRK